MSDRPVIPYGKQHITDEDIEAVNRVLRSDYLTQGPEIVKFEEAFAEYTGARYAVAVSNGTAALHLGALVLGVSSRSRVITTPITFSASANCIAYCGGQIHFADIDPETFLLDPDSVESLLKAAPAGTYDGIIPVDFAGRAVDLERFRELAERYELWIIEDACHAPGGYFTDSKGDRQLCGNGQFADLSVFSFHPVKHIAAGEGGMITTNNQELYEQLMKLRTHGITKNEQEFTNPPATAFGSQVRSGENEPTYPGWYMEMQELGYNYRITDFQAALGNSQLQRAAGGLRRRKEIAEMYDRALSGKSYIRRQSGVVKGHAYHLYVIEAEDRAGLYQHLRDQQIFAQIHYVPVHLMPYYKRLGWKEGDLPHAERYYAGCLSLPIYPTLTPEEQQYVIDSIVGYYG